MGDDVLREGMVLSGTYRVVRLIGHGGMGEVYEAIHQRTGSTFAVKVLAGSLGQDDTILERFRREAEVTSRLRHPNIVKVFDFDRLPDGRPFLAMELLVGADLGALAVRGSRMPVWRVADIVDQISLALFAAHEAGVVHRDLKPANIFIERIPGSDRDLVRVLDFGISKLRNASGELTRTAAIIGTPHYMSPEQATGRGRSIDGRSDQFSLAAIAYELLSGRRAFGADGDDGDDAAMAVIFRVVHQQPAPWKALGLALPEALEQVVARGLAKEPGDRFASIRAFGEAFVAAASAVARAADSSPALAVMASGAPAPRMPPTVILPDTPPPRNPTTLGLSVGETRLFPSSTAETRRPPARRSVPLALALGALAVGGVVLVVVLNRSPPSDGQPASANPARVTAAPPAPTPALRADPPPPPAAAPPPAAPPTVTPVAALPIPVEIRHAPGALTVWEADRELALPLTLPADGRVHRLTFRAPGRRDLSLDVTGRMGESLSLEAMAPARPKPASEPARRPRPRPASPTRNEDIL